MQLSVKEAAALLNLPDTKLYRWIKDGTMPCSKVGDEYRLNRVELLEWATAHEVPVSPDIFREEGDGGLARPSLLSALEAGGVAYGLTGKDQASVLRSVVQALPLPPEVDRDFLYQVLLARESLGSTGIGEGVAIPHVRNPVVLRIGSPLVTLGFLAEPIDFQAIDGQKVDTLFTLICPSVPAHLHLLSRLGFVLRDRELRSALRARAPRDEILALLGAAEARLPRHEA